MKDIKISGGREIKRTLRPLLLEGTPQSVEAELLSYPLRRMVSPLIGFFCDREEIIRWRAVTALGIVTHALAQEKMEEARVVIRRLMWTLNDESGGIGWGAPEAMGEISAVNSRLAEEYHRILCSYVNAEGNFLEHEILQRGALWGLCRLAEVAPEKVTNALPDVRPHLTSKDPVKQGLALLFATRTHDRESLPYAEPLVDAPAPFTLYAGWDLIPTTVGDQARALIKKA
ncbi:DVU0298 family protein [Desulfoluna sp.]|uniref:DVU0298 family protein n=1 Tax=Desulfoluna sp. TaxID=2045199 RepID=UPI00261B1FB7|nr:DVU0298 family protein [Desulfoluna sp.]